MVTQFKLLFLVIFCCLGTLQAQNPSYTDFEQSPFSQFQQKMGCKYCQANKQTKGHSSIWQVKINSNDRSDTLDILNYHIDLAILDFAQARIEGYCEVTFNPKMAGVTSISLDFLQMGVDSVLYNNSSQAAYVYNDTLLIVDFPAALGPADTASVRVYYAGSPQKDATWGGFYFQSGYAYNLGVAFTSDPHNYGRVWHPCFDNFVERATYTFDITTSGTKRAHCNGYQTGETINGSLVTRSWQLDEPIPTYLACVAVADYTTVNLSHTGVNGQIPIELVSLPADTNNFKNSFSDLGVAIDAYEDWFGPHRWNKVGYSAVPFNAGAMEHATNIAYPKAFLDGTNAGEQLMAHELAHSWWGNLVTCETAEDMWINEGMASYCEFLFLERNYGWDRYIRDMKTHHYGVMKNAHTAEGGYLAVSGIPHQYTYGQHVYNKGAVVAHNLRWYLGDSLFRVGMSQVANDYAFKSLNSGQMRDALTASTGVDMTSFYDDWVFSGGFSHFEIDSTSSIPNGGDYEVTVHIEQKLLGASNFHSNVPLQITFMDQQWNKYQARVMVSGQTDIVTLTIPFEPSVFIINEEHRLHQAREDAWALFSQTGSSGIMTGMEITSITDSALFFFEHHLVAPDPMQNNPEGNYHLSDNHYWSIKGIQPNDFEGSGRLYVENRDADLTAIYGSDSMLLLYRPSPETDWVEHPNYSKTQFFGIDYFRINDFLIGDYVFANRVVGVGVDKLQSAILESKVFPNPTDGQFSIEIELTEPLNLRFSLVDVAGQELIGFSERATVGKYIKQLDLSDFSTGMYFLKVQDEKGSLLSNHKINYQSK